MTSLPKKTLWKWLIVIIAGSISLAWLLNTPPGLLGKADAIGYAVCHRIDTHSFHLGDRAIPLCARCSGMYLGVLLGVVYQMAQGKRSLMPPLPSSLFFGLLALSFAVDGINSFLHFLPDAPELYEPHNGLRLFTGTGMGLAMSAFVVPAFNQTVWRAWDNRSALSSWKQVAGLVGLAILMAGLVLLENPLILYPLAILSSVGVLMVLGMIYTMIWLMILRKENRFEHFRQLWYPLLGGFTTALLQISTIDLVRFWATGTWQGFQL